MKFICCDGKVTVTAIYSQVYGWEVVAVVDKEDFDYVAAVFWLLQSKEFAEEITDSGKVAVFSKPAIEEVEEATNVSLEITKLVRRLKREVGSKFLV
jgi:glyceraldehyde-3-phosphate dehydrogenase/erythrose-4-phosphate dehydrogenase